ncbi:uncharacterized protein BJX67DRAFT_178894 [Aspergillus lucknowensis]|uniref:Uncharacterized protein n=1 Tax=Aspergillus lucknowensis TaxID=176173 RepID=A0ABR4LLZ8_9EURO
MVRAVAGLWGGACLPFPIFVDIHPTLSLEVCYIPRSSNILGVCMFLPFILTYLPWTLSISPSWYLGRGNWKGDLALRTRPRTKGRVKKEGAISALGVPLGS